MDQESIHIYLLRRINADQRSHCASLRLTARTTNLDTDVQAGVEFISSKFNFLIQQKILKIKIYGRELKLSNSSLSRMKFENELKRN